MQENLKQLKRSKTLSIIAICLLLVLFTASVFLAVIAPVFTSNVASAADNSVVVSDLQSQANSDYTLKNLLSYRSLYGVFINKEFSLSYDDCVTHDSYFGLLGENNPYFVISSTSSDSQYNCEFVFGPIKITQDVLNDFGVAFTISAPVYGMYVNFWYPNNPGAGDYGFCSLIYNDVEDYNKLINWDTGQFFGIGKPLVAMFDFSKRRKSQDSSVTYSDFVPRVTGFSASMFEFWDEFIYLSLPSIGSIIGVPPEEYERLQTQYNDLLNSMDFSTFNSVDLNSTKPMGNAIGSSTISASYNDVSYGGYWYFRKSVEKDPFSLGLAEFDIGSTLLAGSDIKISYDALFPYNGIFADNVGVVLSFSNFGVFSSASNLKAVSVFIPASDFISKEFIYKFDFDVNYITFGVGTFDSSLNSFNDITLGCDINSSVKQGVFISNFVVKGRGSNFNVAIDNANKQGYNKGYQEGKIAGETIGYQLGVKDQGDYTFMGLLGAVFDAPIQAFKGLLNFEILGVDMTAFVSSLFALAIIVVIIKISLGGK